MLTRMISCRCLGFAHGPAKIALGAAANGLTNRVSLRRARGAAALWSDGGGATAVDMTAARARINDALLHERSSVGYVNTDLDPLGQFQP